MKRIKKTFSPRALNKNEIIIDLESSGYSPQYSFTVAIGIGDWEGNFTQLIIEDKREEENLLKELLPLIEGKKIYTYNRMDFTKKFLEKRFEVYGLNPDLSRGFINIYDQLKDLSFLLDYKFGAQRDLEEFLGLAPGHYVSGREIAKLVKEFELSDKNLFAVDIQKHNQERVLNLDRILLYYKNSIELLRTKFLQTSFTIKNISLTADILYADITFDQAGDRPPLSYQGDGFSVEGQDQTYRVKIISRSGNIAQKKRGRVIKIDLPDQSNYPIAPGYVLVEEGGRYQLNNIKMLLIYYLLEALD